MGGLRFKIELCPLLRKKRNIRIIVEEQNFREQENHGLASLYWYRNWPMFFFINIINIGHISQYYRVNIVLGFSKPDMILPIYIRIGGI